jgi:hypothetical protein
MIATARILTLKMVRLSAGRAEMSVPEQAFCLWPELILFCRRKTADHKSSFEADDAMFTYSDLKRWKHSKPRPTEVLV